MQGLVLTLWCHHPMSKTLCMGVELILCIALVPASECRDQVILTSLQSRLYQAHSQV